MPASTPIVVAIAAATALSAAPAKEKVDDVVASAAQWVRGFERDFITVIADETYDQVVSNKFAPGVLHRTMESELLFMRVEGDESWLAVRNVLSYADEGRPPVNVLNSRDRLMSALERNRAEGRTALRRLADESARFNIGRLARNFNTPTLALQFLDDVHRGRFRFRLQRAEADAGDDVWRVAYQERQHPTIIRANYRDTELSGEIWSRVSDGAVVRTKMDLTAPSSPAYTGLRSSITVAYAWDAKLGRMVPSRMDEEYVETRGETVRATAVYSNYRVFETSARIISSQ